MRPLIAGNWKMFGAGPALDEARTLAASLATQPPAAEVVLCPPSTLICRMAEALAGTAVEVGGQNCHTEPEGPFTGDVSAEMLADAGARWVVLGHSERRTAYQEDDALVVAKVAAALRAGLTPIVCVGEQLEERQAGRTLDVIGRQTRESLPAELKGARFALAYEPVWAIGTGLTPTTEQIAEAHAALRAALAERCGEAGRTAPILYGGSVKPGNAAEILRTPEVGGALVGGASLKAADFLAIVRAAG
jgi:triosephosphate isomerase (TIM)